MLDTAPERNIGVERITIESGNMNGEPCLRGLPIKFWDVYQDLGFHGMTEDKVLQKYPELEPEDLAAVREYAVHLIKMRTHDEFTARAILPKERLRHGPIYKGSQRQVQERHDCPLECSRELLLPLAREVRAVEWPAARR
ncbi:MAG: DUF433 domain-containing protein [Bryobacteraceae bacterium]